MSDAELDIVARRDRSPSFPSVGLEKAVEKTRQLFEKAKRHEVRLTDVAGDWGLKVTSSSTVQLVASLLAFGLIDPGTRSGNDRRIKVSDSGWRILEDHRPGVKEQLLAEAALKPKLIAEYAERWKDGRPDDGHAVSQLKFDSGLTDDAAWKFLRVYEDTIRFAIPAVSDTMSVLDGPGEVRFLDPSEEVVKEPSAGKSRVKAREALMDGERELTTGLLSKGASFRLLVIGKVGEREIERLIKKLQLDKEILAESDDCDLD